MRNLDQWPHWRSKCLQFLLPFCIITCSSNSLLLPITLQKSGIFRPSHNSIFSAALYARKSAPEDIINYEVKSDVVILRQNGFGARLTTLCNFSQPLPCELYENGNWKLSLIVGARSSNDAKKAPLIEVQVLNDGWEDKVVDIGQITSIWSDFYQTYSISINLVHETIESAYHSSQTSVQNDILPKEKAMQSLYNSRHANRNLLHRHILTKKQIPKIAAHSSHPANLEELLRNLLKVGEDRVSRLVDSSMASDYLYNDFTSGNEGIIRRMTAASILTEDAATGGRFKRRSCQFVDFESDVNGVQVTLMNGGWIAVDPSIKSGTEGRKFASLVEKSTLKQSSSAKRAKKETIISSRVFTEADERVAQRLECLAMGDVWKHNSAGEDQRLELDVREALTSMKLPLTPEGAKTALIKIGRWSEGKLKRIEPWPPGVLQAARALAQYQNAQRAALAKLTPSKSATVESRTNLSSLPCVCIDARRTTFRDDAIGLRLRSSTSRRVNKAASKWEVLVHITDVSDVYFGVEGNVDLNMGLLRGAAERRGQSRYDLPLGPLHLLPPVALEALSLSTNQNNAPNQCVTLWAYIDERDGKLLEAGLERTIISSPSALSFAEATKLLESSLEDIPNEMSNAKAILAGAERNLLLWSARHKQINKAARERESRLAARELASDMKMNQSDRDDGVGGSFKRSRAHRLVDSALDLYAFAVGTLMRRAKQPIPRAAGSGADRGGRLGTAPLRRYIDGMAQRQALSVLCGYGVPLTLEECKVAARAATEASNEITNLRSSKQTIKCLPK